MKSKITLVLAALAVVALLVVAPASAAPLKCPPNTHRNGSVCVKIVTGPRGADGPQGPQGERGPVGPAGSNATVKFSDVTGSIGTVCSGKPSCAQVITSRATCPAGSEVVGGGWDTLPGFIGAYDAEEFPTVKVITDRATSRTVWTVKMYAPPSTAPYRESFFAAFAVCATVG